MHNLLLLMSEILCKLFSLRKARSVCQMTVQKYDVLMLDNKQFIGKLIIQMSTALLL